MTFIEMQHTTRQHYITLGVEGNLYAVQVCPLYKDNTAGYPVRTMVYHVSEKKKAYATYKRYIKKYQ